MSYGNNEFNGFSYDYNYSNNNNGGGSYDGQAWFTSFNGEFAYHSQPSFDCSASPQLETSHSPPYQHSSELEMEGAARGGRVGLKLTKTPSFLSSLNELSNRPDSTSAQKSDGGNSASPEKLKAANFPVLSLQIGSWKKVSRHEGELVAKCYFKKKKLVWEVLDGNLKRKVEFQWSDVSAIRAIFPQNSPAVLDIMLARSPLFFQEVNPQPRKHTNWEQSYDFTDNQASLFRRHTLLFSQGLLEKHYEKLLQADRRLKDLSRRPFPDQASPLFSEIHFSNNSCFDNNPSNSIPLGHHLFPNFNEMSPVPGALPVQNDMRNYPVQDTLLDPNATMPGQFVEQSWGYDVNQLQMPPAGTFGSADVPYLGYGQSQGWDYQAGHNSFGGAGAPWL